MNQQFAYRSLTVWDEEYQLLKLLSAHKGQRMRDLFCIAFEEMIDARESWTAVESHERYSWIPTCKPGEGRVPVTACADRELVERLSELADEDGISRVDAFYTALRTYLVKENREYKALRGADLLEVFRG